MAIIGGGFDRTCVIAHNKHPAISPRNLHKIAAPPLKKTAVPLAPVCPLRVSRSLI